VTRRTILTRAVQGIGLIITGVIGIPTLIHGLAPGLRRRGEVWRGVGEPADFPPDEVRRAVVTVPTGDYTGQPRPQAVYVWNSPEEGIVVFSRNCTDLSCPVIWDGGSERFFCPCHGGIFTKRGEVVAGPPRRPLFRYATRIEDGQLQIDLDSLPPVT
jgi:menaquinol-cytochrome c reductase iron-sulfur subunit